MNDKVRRGGLFGALSDDDAQTVLESCERLQLKRRDVLVRQGDLDRTMYVIESGSFRVSVVSEEGKEVSLGLLEAGDSVGELSLLDGRARSATVTANSKAQVRMLRRETFLDVVRTHPDIAVRLLEEMAGRLRAADELYEDSVFLEVPERLAKWLLRLAGSHGRIQPEGTLIDISLSQYELGTLANASRESVNKQLKAWEAEGIIETGRGWILLRDVDALQARTEPS